MGAHPPPHGYSPTYRWLVSAQHCRSSSHVFRTSPSHPNQNTEIPMTILDQRLARKGRNTPRGPLYQQGTISIDLAQKNAILLGDFGWSVARTTSLMSDVET